MLREDLELALQERLKTDVAIEPRGKEDFRIITPFHFDDGDILKIILKRRGDDEWELTDEGHTLMYISYYDINMNTETRANILQKIVSSHFMNEENGRLFIRAQGKDDLAGSLFSFIQGIVKVSDMALWNRERVHSLFYEEFHSMIETVAGDRKLVFDYYDPVTDKERLRKVDCVIMLRQERPFHVFAVNNDSKGKDALIVMMHHELNGLHVPTSVIFENAEEIGRKTAISIGDMADKTFSSLNAAQDRMPRYIEKLEAVNQ